MSRLTTATWALALALGSGAGVAIEPGKPLTDPAFTPWTALVLVDGSPCGGSLIDEHWVVTARHCVDVVCGVRNDDGDTSDDARLGLVEVRILGKKSTFPVKSVECPQPSYQQQGVPWPDDVALLKIQYVRVRERRLPTLASRDMTPGSDAPSRYLVSVGWSDGDNGFRGAPQALKLVPLSQAAGAATLAAPGACTERLALGPTQFVAVAPPRAPAGFYGLQQGDSGGPLVRQGKPRPELVGVASAACSNNGLPIYEDLYDRRCWIAETACDFYREKKLREGCWERLLGGSTAGCTFPDGP